MLALKVPPLVLGVFMAALMWLMAWVTPAFGFELPARRLLTLSAAVLGAVIILLGIVSFGRAGTTVNPRKPQSSSSLVTTGMYAYSRNPMYLGFLLILLAWTMYLSNVVAVLFLPLFVLYMNRFQIEPEEKALASLFGQEFTAYRSRVRRWL